MSRPTPRRVAAWLFDLDGTLLDSRLDIAEACNHALRQAGRAQLSVERIGSFVGDGARSLVARAFDLDKDDPKVSAHLEDFLAFYEEHPLQQGRLYPGARELLGALAGSRVGICTNKTRRVTERIVAGLGVPFDVVVAGGDTPELKPHPGPLIFACERLGVAPSDCVFVGDSAQDVLAAHAAGCYAIGILGGFGSEERLVSSNPDILVENLSALERWAGEQGLIRAPHWP